MFEKHKQKKKRLREINNSYNALFNYLYDVPKESYYIITVIYMKAKFKCPKVTVTLLAKKKKKVFNYIIWWTLKMKYICNSFKWDYRGILE
jgi:hypothetical protein